MFSNSKSLWYKSISSSIFRIHYALENFLSLSCSHDSVVNLNWHFAFHHVSECTWDWSTKILVKDNDHLSTIRLCISCDYISCAMHGQSLVSTGPTRCSLFVSWKFRFVNLYRCSDDNTCCWFFNIVWSLECLPNSISLRYKWHRRLLADHIYSLWPVSIVFQIIDDLILSILLNFISLCCLKQIIDCFGSDAW